MNLKINRFRLTVILLPLLFGFLSVHAQTGSLENYIAEGLKNNIVLQQKSIDVKKAIYALQHAESLFLPTVSFQGGYQTGAGGRSISLPVGDMMNPVYSTLNQLTGTEKFSSIGNVEQDFLAKNFYDAKIRTTMPIINTDLKFNKKIEEQKVALEKYDVEGYKIELVRNIKVAYYNYFSALKVLAIYESALVLANENLRVNERLLQNGKGLPSYVLRSKSEQENMKARITEAKKGAENATLYFNFLLNRNSTDSIYASVDLSKEFDEAVSLITVQPDVSKRPELTALTEVIKLRNTVISMNKKYWVPRLNGFLDLGSQSQNFNFNSKSAYYNVGLQLDIPLFNGKRNLIKIKQAELDKKNAALNLDYTSQQLTLSAATIQNNLLSVYQVYQSSLKAVESAASYQRLIQRGFKEGVNTFIEDIDGRNLLTAAQLQANISFYNVLITAANLQRETGSSKY
jgi:outer membrane protein TolC